jgi:Rrf2 family transcriptional regulator, nitric oxide-sensitive transcriptional repressor
MRLTMFTDYGLRTLMYVDAKGESYPRWMRSPNLWHFPKWCTTWVVGATFAANAAASLLVGSRQRSVRELEGDLGLFECYRQRGCCLEPVCVLCKALDEALLAFLSVLSRYTLADLLKPDPRLKSFLQIPILASRSAH